MMLFNYNVNIIVLEDMMFGEVVQDGGMFMIGIVIIIIEKLGK